MEYNLFTAKHYLDEAIFEAEMRKIFSDCWHFAGLVDDLKQDNHFLTVQVGHNNIVIVRDQAGELSAFHNICRHRGMQLVEGKGVIEKASLSCPYHDWTYDWQGKLKGLPKQKHEFTELDKACLSLKPAQVGVWRGMLWVHPDSRAEPLQSYFAQMNHHIAAYDTADLIESTDDLVEYEIEANWKLIVENYIDHYHLAQLHAGTLSMYDHSKAEFGFTGDHFYFWEPVSEDFRNNIGSKSYLPLIMDENDEKLGAYVPMLFPCFGLAENESSWSIYQIIPLSVTRSKVVIRSKVKKACSLSFFSQSAKSSGYWASKQRAKLSDRPESHPLGSGDFMQEDIYVCEQLQKSLQSPYFEFGPSASHGESPIRGFQQRILAWLEK